jgi:hypothetical protein
MTSEFIDVPITMIEPTGAKPTKSERGEWRAPVIYVLEDGRRIEAHLSSRLKRDLVAELATLPAAPTNPTKATFHNGEFFGTSTSFSLR